MEEINAEIYKLTINNIGLGDDGIYVVSASNNQGDSSQQAKLTVHSKCSRKICYLFFIDFLYNIQYVYNSLFLIVTISFIAEVPSFVKNLEDKSLKDYEALQLRVRINGVPKPQVKWFVANNVLRVTDDSVM